MHASLNYRLQWYAYFLQMTRVSTAVTCVVINGMGEAVHLLMINVGKHGGFIRIQLPTIMYS